MSTPILTTSERSSPVLFSYGFRPFFLLAGVGAAALVPVWLLMVTGIMAPESGIPLIGWHAHEMIYGFVVAAVAGFLLTAIPSWTGAPPITGRPLIALVALFLAGRIASLPWIAAEPIAAIVDLAFLPVFGVMVGIPVVQARKMRNMGFLVLIALLVAANLAFHLDWAGLPWGSYAFGAHLAIGVVAMMIAVIGGRIIPAFTQNSLRTTNPAFGIVPLPWLDRAAIAAIGLAVAADLALPGSTLSGLIALAAAVLHGARLARWKGLATLGRPILWILHAGYAWLVIGLALKGLEEGLHMPLGMAWLHALTAGCFATMIVAVMSRAALGHTGRRIEASPMTVAAYSLILLAGIARPVAAALGGDVYLYALGLAGAAWTVGFGLFVAAYAPVLTGPRADGHPG